MCRVILVSPDEAVRLSELFKSRSTNTTKLKEFGSESGLMSIRQLFKNVSRSKGFSCGRSLNSVAARIQEQPSDWQPLPPLGQFRSSQTGYNALEIAMQKKRKIDYERTVKRRPIVAAALHLREGTNEEILQLEVEDLLHKATQSQSEPVESTDGNEETKLSLKHFPAKPPIELGSEAQFDVAELSSTGEGLAYTPDKGHIIVIPFTVPGDKVLARVFRWVGTYSHADFIKIVEPSKLREGVTPECKYFADCGGCQLQMIPYDQQLQHKKTIVKKAFEKFSGLSPDHIPAVRDTMGSPIQYKYRTKLTPHFDGPGRRKGDIARFSAPPRIGYNRKNTRHVIDIEHCPIGTDILQEGLKIERAKVAVNYANYKTGRTILLRESTRREVINNNVDETWEAKGESNMNDSVAEFDTTTIPDHQDLHTLEDGRPELTLTFPTRKDHKTYTSIETSSTTEYIGPHKFVNRAGSFFQNNNSILGPFTKYIYDNCIPPSDTTTTTTSAPTAAPQIKYLLDAYCGSGLFTITLSKLFTSALGIDIDGRGIEAARQNALINNIPNAGFIEADASDLFADVPFPPDQSLVVIDPPRKGASEGFLRQLCQFRARRVVYVSCNVHTQARDVGMIVKGFESGVGHGCRYEIESLRGFDFFPQTGHVEGVCVLNRVDV